MPSDLELWNRIVEFTPDDPGAHCQFTDRLARENGWTKAFARSAVEEYKRFIYLACVGDTQVTPSDIVDQVWHLHLTFTRSYWNDLCGDILQRPLHHGPSKGGRREDARFRDQYDETLALYRTEFGENAPRSHWPPAEQRFASAPHQSWVDRRTHWVVAKPQWRHLLLFVALSGAVGGTGIAHADDGEAVGLSREVEIGGLVLAAVMLIGALLGTARTVRTKSKENSSDAGVVLSAGAGGGSSKGHGADGDGAGDGGGCGGGCGS